MEQVPRRRSCWTPWRCGCGCLLLLALPLLFIVFVGTPDGNSIGARFARRNSCLANLKQCAQATIMYADDYDSMLPSSYSVSHSKKWNTRAFLTFATQLGEFPPATARKTWPQILYDNMRQPNVFCYYDNAPSLNSSNKSEMAKAQVSYWWKAAVDKAWYGEGCPKPHQLMSDYPNKPKCVIFYERGPFHFQDRFGFNSRPYDAGLRDGLKINVAYLDGHSGMVTIGNATSGDPRQCAANSNGEPMYFNFDNKIGKKLANSMPASYVDPTQYSDSLE